MSKNVVYVVCEESRTRNCNVDSDFTVLDVCSTKDGAESVVKRKKAEINELWKDQIDLDEYWEEEADEWDKYTLADTTDYENYYSVWVEEKEVH